MQIRLTIDTDGQAFEGESLGPEVARLLEGVARRVKTLDQAEGNRLCGGTSFPLLDLNGNVVGSCTFD